MEITEIWYVTLYLEDMAYGGSEEGGWWYDVGEPIMDSELNKKFSTEEEARDYYEKMQEKLTEMNEGRHDKYSVLSDGEYHFHVDNEPPVAYPTHRPHYE